MDDEEIHMIYLKEYDLDIMMTTREAKEIISELLDSWEPKVEAALIMALHALDTYKGEN